LGRSDRAQGDLDRNVAGTRISTVAVGLVPTYANIGVWGAVLLTVIRLIQGIRGWWRMGRLRAVGDGMGADDQEPRLPHILAAIRRAGRVLFSQSRGVVFQLAIRRSVRHLGLAHPVLPQHRQLGIGLWIRLGILETPVFEKVLAEERVERVPVPEVLKRQPKQVVLSALLRMAEQAPGYIVGAFIFTYGTTVLGVSRDFLLMAVLVQCFLGFLRVVVAATLSDRIGRKNMFMIGCAFVVVYGSIYFGLLDTKVPMLIFIAVALSLLPVMTCYGPEAALIAESFTPRLRYSGASLGYQLASIIAGGPSPFIATELFAAFKPSLPIALYMVGCSIIGVVSTALLTDYTDKDIFEEYDKIQPARAIAD
jgi:hypothetical protein